MLRCFWLGVRWTVVTLTVATLTGAFSIGNMARAAQDYLIPVTTVSQHGLTRAWSAQVEVTPGKLNYHATYYENVLYVQTDGAMVVAIDAETGKTIWSKQVGTPGYPSMVPGVRGEMAAVLNGPRLFVLNRENGDLLFEKDTKEAPGAGPALSSRRAYVPMVSGMMMVYRVESPSELARAAKVNTKEGRTEAERQQGLKMNLEYAVPLCHQSTGRLLTQPLVTLDDKENEYLAWTTDRGYLNFGHINSALPDAFTLKYRLGTSAPITATPAYLLPDPKQIGSMGVVFATSHDGFLYAIQEDDGTTLWRFSTGEPISQSPVAIENRVYIATDRGNMYCIDAKTGKSVWRAEDAMRFVAASKSRIYADDADGNLAIFNAENGVKLDAVPIGGSTVGLMNADTDRIFLLGENGLIQCLRESDQDRPLVHNKDRKEAAKAGLLAQKVEEEKPVKLPQSRGTPSSTPAAAPTEPATPKEPKTPKTPVKKNTGRTKKTQNNGAGL